jgi:hypothetical protein
MTSSDSGVVISTWLGNSRNDFLRASETSPCHLNADSPTIRA